MLHFYEWSRAWVSDNQWMDLSFDHHCLLTSQRDNRYCIIHISTYESLVKKKKKNLKTCYPSYKIRRAHLKGHHGGTNSKIQSAGIFQNKQSHIFENWKEKTHEELRNLKMLKGKLLSTICWLYLDTSWGWPWTSDPTASTSQILGWQFCASTSSFHFNL